MPPAGLRADDTPRGRNAFPGCGLRMQNPVVIRNKRGYREAVS
jgi:hypothetical protein